MELSSPELCENDYIYGSATYLGGGGGSLGHGPL